MNLYEWYKNTNKIYLIIAIIIIIVLIYIIYNYFNTRNKRVTFSNTGTEANMLALFHSKDCPHCVNFIKGVNGKSEWLAFKQKYGNSLKKDANIDIVDVDVDTPRFKEIQKNMKYNITGVPAIALYKNNEWLPIMDIEKYNRDSSQNGIIKYIQDNI